MTRLLSTFVLIGIVSFFYAQLPSAVSHTNRPVEPQRTATAPPQVQVRAAPAKAALFDDQELPYLGLGAVWNAPDGLVLIETADDGGIAFYANLDRLWLVEVPHHQLVFVMHNEGGKPVRQFGPSVGATPVVDPEPCFPPQTPFYSGGELTLDYDETTGRLFVELDAGSQVLSASFNFTGASEPVGGVDEIEDAEPQDEASSPLTPRQNDSSPREEQPCTCECTYDGPPGGDCTACNRCPPRYICTCKCNCNGCSCSQCKRPRAVDVQVEM